uniref:Lipoprotein n=1 Tax=Pseudomonas phage Cygsa01 TaxID=3138529 RepID=A0AAU6W3P3_9VIRU
MFRTAKAAFSALALAAALSLAGCGDKPNTAPSTPVYKSYIGFNGDCYAEPKPDVQRCLTESTRGGGGAK